MITVLIGKSASGKDTLMKELINFEDFTPIVSSTTRPMRENEKDGVDYNFVNFEDFINTNFVETREYKTSVGGKEDTWFYGSPKVNPDKEKYITVLDVQGFNEYVKNYGKENIIPVFLECKEEVRRERAMKRGSFDETEWNRRVADDDIKITQDKMLSKDNLIIINSDELGIQRQCAKVGALVEKIERQHEFKDYPALYNYLKAQSGRFQPNIRGLKAYILDTFADILTHTPLREDIESFLNCNINDVLKYDEDAYKDLTDLLTGIFEERHVVFDKYEILNFNQELIDIKDEILDEKEELEGLEL